MGSDHCAECSRVITKRQHSMTCEKCDKRVHRICNTGISQKEYWRILKGKIPFTCSLCINITENAPAESTRIENLSFPSNGYGSFNISLISRRTSTETSLNSTFTVPNPVNSNCPNVGDVSTPKPSEVEASRNSTLATTPFHLNTKSLDASFDLTHRQEDNDDQEIVEESLQEPDLPNEILPDVPPSYTVIDKGTQRSNIKLVSSDGYEYTRKMSKGDFTYWRCIKRTKGNNCPATVSQKGNVFKRNPKQHKHQADKGALKRVLVHKEVKHAALQDIHKPARRIVDDAMLKHIEPDDHTLPKVNNLKRTANRAREDLRPDEPDNLYFELDHDYLQCDNFLVADIKIDGERHLVFSTPMQLQLLKFAKKWFCDGTFKIVKDPFVQLWSIHAFIRKGESLKQVPLVFVLMSRKKTKDYIQVLESLLEKIGPLHVEGFCLDFEKGAWKAIRQIFPDTGIKGCAFHFSQAVWRKVQELGMKTTYSQRGAEYNYIRCLMALPFLPYADILPAFEKLACRANSKQLKDLVRYMSNTWFEGPYWSPRTWSIFEHSIRTNNDVEGWHTRINMGKINVSFYVLVPELMREAELVDLTHRLVSEEQVLRCQKNKSKELEGRLHQYWQEYADGEKTTTQLLRDCSKIYGPSDD